MMRIIKLTAILALLALAAIGAMQVGIVSADEAGNDLEEETIEVSNDTEAIEVSVTNTTGELEATWYAGNDTTGKEVHNATLEAAENETVVEAYEDVDPVNNSAYTVTVTGHSAEYIDIYEVEESGGVVGWIGDNEQAAAGAGGVILLMAVAAIGMVVMLRDDAGPRGGWF